MRHSTTLLLTCFVAMAAAVARGHEADEPTTNGADKASHAVIKTSGDKRIIEANGLPDHKPGQFPNRGNPNSISAQKYRFEMPLKPHAATSPAPSIDTRLASRSTASCSIRAPPRSGVPASRSSTVQGERRAAAPAIAAVMSGTTMPWAK